MKRFKDEALGYLKDMFAQSHMATRTILSFFSIVIMGLGISLFSVSDFGVDPYTSMNMNVASTLGVRFGTYQMILNGAITLFVIIVAHRGLVGVGTVINMVVCGYACEFFQSIIKPFVESHYVLAVRIPLLLAGIVTLCYACSLFFTANIGVGPYDSLSFMLSSFTKIHLKWARVITDVTVVLIGLVVSGGLTALLKGDLAGVKNIGIGTVITAFCMGPLISFFSKHINERLFNAICKNSQQGC